MRTPKEVLNAHEDLASYWRREIRRRYEMQMPRPHDPLEIRSIMYGRIIAELYYTLKRLEAELAAHLENEGDECPLCQLEKQVDVLQEIVDRVVEIRGHVHLGAIIGSMLDAYLEEKKEDG